MSEKQFRVVMVAIAIAAVVLFVSLYSGEDAHTMYWSGRWK